MPPPPVPALVPVAVIFTPLSAPTEAAPKLARMRRSGGLIEISLGGGRRGGAGPDGETEALRRMLDALEGRSAAGERAGPVLCHGCSIR